MRVWGRRCEYRIRASMGHDVYPPAMGHGGWGMGRGANSGAAVRLARLVRRLAPAATPPALAGGGRGPQARQATDGSPLDRRRAAMGMVW